MGSGRGGFLRLGSPVTAPQNSELTAFAMNGSIEHDFALSFLPEGRRRAGAAGGLTTPGPPARCRLHRELMCLYHTTALRIMMCLICVALSLSFSLLSSRLLFLCAAQRTKLCARACSLPYQVFFEYARCIYLSTVKDPAQRREPEGGPTRRRLRLTHRGPHSWGGAPQRHYTLPSEHWALCVLEIPLHSH